jgi:3-hydroxyisobutyrate dehydrogenase
MNVAFLGLGVMGYPMAGHLKAKGHEVTVYNRTYAKAEAWVAQHGGKAARTPAEAATGQDFVFACVGNDDDLRAVTIGEGGAFMPPPPPPASTSSTRPSPAGRPARRTAC